MVKLTQFKTHRGINSVGLLISIAATAIFLTAAFWKPAALRGSEQLSRKIQIGNHTQSVEVLSAERDDGSIHISLRNNSTKSVDGLQVRVGDVVVQTEFLGTDITFMAGSVHEERYPTQQDSANRGVELLCATFEDGSSEGHKKYVEQIEDKRVGERMQTRRALALLDQALAHSNVNAKILDKLKKDISSLPVRDSNNDVMLGLHDRKTQLTNQIEGILSKQAHANTSGPQELRTLKQHLNRSIKQ